MVIAPRNALIKILGGTVVWLLILGQTLEGVEEPAPPPRLQGTFIQLLNTHGEWKAENWSELFEYFRQLRLSQLVVQWTVYDETAFYPTPDYKTVANPPLETILQLADASGMKVWVGLAHAPRFWEKIRRNPILVEVYLRRLWLRSESVASQLASLVQKHSSFQGWYITEEVDDINWREPEAREVLFEYLRDLSFRLHEITPGGRVALSGFSNAHADPQAFEEFWRALLGTASVDVVLFQDGIGVEKLQLAYLPLYLAAMRKAVEAHSRDLQVVVEIFRQVDGLPFNDEPFKAVPAPLERINCQVDLAAPYSTSGIIAFSVPEYMTPLGGQEAGRLFESYLMELGAPH